jgi:hypothetical protein
VITFDPDTLGWLAAGLTLATFICRDMRRLRLMALAANVAFIGYGAVAQIWPVLVLHLALVPVNLWRLNQAFRSDPGPSADGSWRADPGARVPRRRRRPLTWRTATSTPRRHAAPPAPSSRRCAHALLKEPS